MYLALARKYRPQTFGKLIGQPHITRTLQNAIKMERLYPSLIFSGMKGVGKTSTARILAKALNCEKGPAVEPCNKCEICREITADRSPDYIEIDGASNNGIEEVRSLREKIRYRPFKNRFRIVVIDEVHMLSNSAWNALLKTVEEPPEHTYFILATTDFQKIPSTIVSRSQHYEFRQIPDEVIIEVLKEIAGKEKIKISEHGLFLIAHAAEGSLRDAKKIFDQAIALSDGDVDDESLRNLLGILEEDLFLDITESIFAPDRPRIIQLIGEIVERGIDLRFFYHEYLKFFRELMVIRMLGADSKLHRLNPSSLERGKKITGPVSEVELLRYFNAAKELETGMRSTQNPRLLLEYLFLKLSFFPGIQSIEKTIRSLESGKTVPVSPSPPSREAKSPADKARAPDPLLKRIKSYLKGKKIPEKEIAAAELSIQKDSLVIGLPTASPAMEKFLNDNHRPFQEKIGELSERRVEYIKLNRPRKSGSDSGVKDLDKIRGFAKEINMELIDIKDLKGGNNAEDA